MGFDKTLAEHILHLKIIHGVREASLCNVAVHSQRGKVIL